MKKKKGDDGKISDHKYVRKDNVCWFFIFQIKKKDPKTLKAFTIPHTIRKAWQAAVSEAESLIEASR